MLSRFSIPTCAHSDKSWINFVKAIQAITLFENEFDEFIKFENLSTLCSSWWEFSKKTEIISLLLFQLWQNCFVEKTLAKSRDELSTTFIDILLIERVAISVALFCVISWQSNQVRLEIIMFELELHNSEIKVSLAAQMSFVQNRQLCVETESTSVSLSYPVTERRKLGKQHRHKTLSWFWNNSSPQWLTSRALRELDRRTTKWSAASLSSVRLCKEDIDIEKLQTLCKTRRTQSWECARG